MSIGLMTEVWKSALPMTEKMVLLCLADFANDRGECWPSVDTIAGKCSCSDRTVQKAIKSLRGQGILRVEDAPGKSHSFTIDPRKIFTPEDNSPPKNSAKGAKNIHPRGERGSPKPSENHQEPPKNNTARKPDDLDEQVWKDWKRVRKKPITPTVMAGLEREAARVGWTVSQAITHAAENSWQSFKADWVKDNGRNSRPERKSVLDIAAELGGDCGPPIGLPSLGPPGWHDRG